MGQEDTSGVDKDIDRDTLTKFDKNFPNMDVLLWSFFLLSLVVIKKISHNVMAREKWHHLCLD